MRTIAFFSLKGGCGKTTSCVNIAAALAEMGRRVLIVDLDANACASRTFGVIASFDDSIGAALLAHTVRAATPAASTGARAGTGGTPVRDGKPLKAVIQPTEVDGIWLVPARAELRSVEHRPDIHDPERVNQDGSLNDTVRRSPCGCPSWIPRPAVSGIAGQGKRQGAATPAASAGARAGTGGTPVRDGIALSWELFDLGKAFDYVLVDCPADHDIMHRLALLACDEVIIPTGLSVDDLHATTPSLQLILSARKAREENDRPLFLSFLPNGAGKRGVPAPIRHTLDEYHAPCFSPVRRSGLLKTMTGRRLVRQRLIVLARPEHPAAVRYREIAREIELGIEAARQLAAELAKPPGGLTPPSLLAMRNR